MDHVETIVVGGGQAGLATSYHLVRAGREHLVLERAARPADAWRSGRWDSFMLVTPNSAFRMPGAEYRGTDPRGFMSLDEIIAFFDAYAERFHLPVQCRSEVTSIEPLGGGGYRVQTQPGEAARLGRRWLPHPDERRDPPSRPLLCRHALDARREVGKPDRRGRMRRNHRISHRPTVSRSPRAERTTDRLEHRTG